MVKLTPRQAAFVAEVSPSTVRRAIDRAEVESEGPNGSPELGIPELVYLKMRGEISPLLSATARKKLYRSIRSEYVRKRNLSRFRRTFGFGPLQVNVASAVQSVADRMAELENAREHVVRDEAIRGGESVIRGTRIPVYLLAELTAQGATEDEVLADYPSLTREMLRAALLYAETHPRRGRRPVFPPWRKRQRE